MRLLPSRYLEAQEANGRYLLQLEPDRFLHQFRVTAGLKPKGEQYGGWEARGVAGHSLGHYLSACSYQFAATGDPKFRDRVVYTVRELAECQSRRTDGYIGAIPGGEKLWDEIRRGDVRSEGFDLNGHWVPWYTQHKILAGLIDAYRIAKVEEALPIATRLGEWALWVTEVLTPAQWQLMLQCEHGGMNESLAELSVLTKDARFLDLARKFHHEKVLGPLEQKVDQLAGLHANTQIPKLIGLARLFEIEGKAKDRTAAEFFWDRVVNHRSYAIGANSNHEHLVEPDRLNDQLGPTSSETCNTYNMLKLTRHLDAWQPKASWYDFYERALTNHILGSQRRSDGMLAYYMPLQAQATRPYSTPFDSFWCCVGTGMENHARYGEAIFTRGEDELRVNLFIPSVLDSASYGKVKLESGLPASGEVKLTVVKAANWTLAVRKPSWLAGEARFRVNGRAAKAEVGEDGYYRLQRGWKGGDVIEWTLPMSLRTEAMPDNRDRIALAYGPTILAAVHSGEEGIDSVFVPERKSVANWLKKLPGKELRFRSQGVLRPKDLEFIPFAETADVRYTTYFDRFSTEKWRAMEKAYREEQEIKAAVEAATIDVFRPGEMQPERDHEFQGERTETGEHQGRKWRHAIDGWFSFKLKVAPDVANLLVFDYWSGDTGREFDILVDDSLVAIQKHEALGTGFVQVRYRIPLELTKGKSVVTVKLASRNGSIAGGLYGARTVREDRLPAKKAS